MFPLTALTHGSILRSPTKPDDLAKFAKEMGYPSLPLTDVNNLSQVVPYYKAMKKAELKPVIGMRVDLLEGQGGVGHMVLLCKNATGWRESLRLVNYMGEGVGLDPMMLNHFDTSGWIAITRGTSFASGKIVKSLVRDHYTGCDGRGGAESIPGSPVVPVFENACLRPQDQVKLSLLYGKEKGAPPLPPTGWFSNEREVRALGFGDEEIRRTLEIFDKIEDFELTRKQAMPRHADVLRVRCTQELVRRSLKDTAHVERLNYELKEIEEANMEGYFLIVSDIMSFLRERGRLLGFSRGSAAGCLISYLLGITQVDPLEYGLLFERFYSKDRGGFPDIDVDIPPDSRDIAVDFVQERYGKENFAQLSTFNTLKAAAAIKLALKDVLNFREVNQISLELTYEHKITPELQQQKKEMGTDSGILWTLLNEPNRLAQWCTYNKEKDSYEGEFGSQFKVAVELNGVNTGRGRHPSAFAISDIAIKEKAPVIFDSVSKREIVGVEMESAEYLGLVKLDLLGLDLLTKAEEVRDKVCSGSIMGDMVWQ